MNDTHLSFCGWVGSDVSLSEVGNGSQVASFRVGSTPRRFRNGHWENAPTCWYTVKAWRTLAEHVYASVHNGDAVAIQGRLVADVWEKEDGQTSTRYVVVATSVGHDLNRGTSEFTKVARQGSGPGIDESPAQQVIHSYDEGGPRLDSDGEVVADPPERAAEPAA